MMVIGGNTVSELGESDLEDEKFQCSSKPALVRYAKYMCLY